MVLALAMLAPPILLGALAHTLWSLGLADLGFPGATTPTDLEVAQQGFRADFELVEFGLFVIFGLLTLGALHITEDALGGLQAFSLAALLFLTYVVFQRWDFGGSLDAARIASGVALWGLGWVLIMLHLFSLLRSTPHRKWNWVTGTVGLVQAAAFFLTLELAIFVSLEWAALVVAVLGLAAAAFFMGRRGEIRRLWGYQGRGRVQLPPVEWRGGLLVALYAVLAFGMIGAEYVHHFRYDPTFDRPHYVLMAATTPLGIVLFGTLSERGGRRSLLYGVPLVVGFAVLAENLFGSPWPVAVAEGIMLGAVPYLFQYLAEATMVLTRGTIYLFSLGAVVVLAAGGTVATWATFWTPIDENSLVLAEMAALLFALLLAPQLPETRPQVSESEELADYLELARRIQHRP